MEQNQQLFALQIDPVSKANLAETARWARFLAIVGFVFCALIVLVGVFFGSIMSTMMGSGLPEGESAILRGGMGAFAAVLYIFLAVLYFFPCLFLYRFASKMRIALNGDSQEDLSQSFQNLKSMFKFLGILTIIIIAIYGIVFLIGLVSVAASR